MNDPEAVATYGRALLSSHTSRLSASELWLVREQVALAAFALGATSLSCGIVSAVHKRFPRGVRASRLAGMLAERSGDRRDAGALYARELEVDPANAQLLKRRVAMSLEAQDGQQAVTLLKNYLTLNSQDWAAWEELADVYILQGALPQAAFCLEEVLLHQPLAAGVLLKLAEALASGQDKAGLRTARSLFAAVVELSAGSETRALYGVLAVSALLGKADSDELPALCAQTLRKRYAAQAPANVEMLEAMLKAMGH